MYKVTYKNKNKDWECFFITDYERATRGVVKTLLDRGYKLEIKKLEEKK